MRINSKKIINQAVESFDLTQRSLEILKNKLDKKFIEAVKYIVSARQVFVSGVGKSGIIAQKIAATFTSIGVPSFFLHPVEALHGDIGMVRRGDVVILLSKSGTTDELVRILPYIKKRKVKIISIITNTQSYLANNSDIVLEACIERESCPFNIAPTTSSLIALAIGDALAVCSMTIKNMTVEDFAQNHPLGQIGKNLTMTVADIMHKGKSLPLIYTQTSIKDALIEITDKSLGCVCVIDKTGILKGIITDGDIRRLLNKTDNVHGLKAKDIMTINPISVTKDTFLGEALSIMENRSSQINVLPVVNSLGKCIGVIRLHDIVRSGL